jgi:hypothetical protein
MLAEIWVERSLITVRAIARGRVTGLVVPSSGFSVKRTSDESREVAREV